MLGAVAVGVRDDDVFSSLANRLIRLDKQISDEQREQFMMKAGGRGIADVARDLLAAFSPDTIDAVREQIIGELPNLAPGEIDEAVKERHEEIVERAAAVFTGDLNEFVENVRRALEQIIDLVNPDKVIKAAWDENDGAAAGKQAAADVRDFAAWIEQNKDEITALQIFYNQPFRRRELTLSMIRELAEKLKLNKPRLAPLHVWQAYRQLEESTHEAKTELTALVALVRRVCGIDTSLTAYEKTIDRNFQNWVFGKQSGALKFNEEQMRWLRMIKEHVATSFHIEREDFEYEPFAPVGGLGKMYQLFGEQMNPIIEEINEALAA